MEYSIVIVSYNQSSLLYRCLSSVRTEIKRSGRDGEIIVVDNNSGDASVEVARQFGALVHCSEINLGFAAANNLGFSLSRGRLVLLLNSDAALFPGSLNRLAEALDGDPGMGAVGGLEMRPDGRIARTWWPYPTLWRDTLSLLGPSFSGNAKLDPQRAGRLPAMISTSILPGYCIMVKREVLDQVGGLDGSLFFYGEDVEWSWRIGKAGWRMAVIRDAPVMHVGGASSTGIGSSRRHYLLAKGRLNLYRKHRSEREARIYFHVLVFMTFLQSLLPLLLYPYPPARRFSACKRNLLRMLCSGTKARLRSI
ncbi:MAG: glycosyltransferase family 2 protein [bacterium]|nr:glycosyltransferase family 2 protein [bacterium]